MTSPTDNNPIMATPELAVARSRKHCMLGEYEEAVSILTSIPEIPREQRSKNTEIARVHFIRGDRKAASQVLATHNQFSENADLTAMFKAFIDVSLHGELDNALQTAAAMWSKYRSVMLSNNGNEVAIRILYYCLEIHDLWKRYGEGHESSIDTDELLQRIIAGLTTKELYFEALEVVQFLTEDPAEQLEAILPVLQESEDEGATLECNLRLAQIQGEDGELEHTETALETMRDRVQPFERLKRMHDRIRLRFLEIKESATTRIQLLVKMAKEALENDHFDEAMKCLEDAAELHCELPASPENYELGLSLHDDLKSLCERSGDALSLHQFEFRRCDMICSLTGRLSEARKLRDELLQSPLSSKLPFFEKNHKRQYFEYSMLHQRNEALHHAELYLKFCQNYKSEEEQAYANALRLSALTRPSRMSEEAREASLEATRQELETAIAIDKEKGFDVARLRSTLLLVNVVRELAEIQQTDKSEVSKMTLDLLNEAEKIGNNTELSMDDVWLRYQVGMLKAELASEQAKDQDQRLGLDESQTSDADSLGLTEYRFKKSYHRASFSYSKYMYNLGIVMQSNSQLLLKELIGNVSKEDTRLRNEGHTLEKAEFYVFKGFLYLALAEADAESGFWNIAGFASRHAVLESALEALKIALGFDEAHWREVSEQKSRIGVLLAKQLYTTRPLEHLIFTTALTVCSKLDDLSQTWTWIQHSKARGYSSMLSDIVHDNSHPAPSSVKAVTFEDMLWASTASPRRIVFVDWTQYGESSDKITLFCLWFEDISSAPVRRLISFEIGMTVSEIEQLKERLNPATLDDSSAQRILSRFRPLVDPLLGICDRDDLLVFCPTGPLHNIALHAIEIGDEPLIARNPIVYTPSLFVLIAGLKKLEGRSTDGSQRLKPLIIEAYDDPASSGEALDSEKLAVSNNLNELATTIGARKVNAESDLSLETFKEQVAGTSFLHFHGHGNYDPHDITRQGLILGPTNALLTLQDVAELSLDRAHVTLMACEAGLQDYSLAGDEPLGLLSTFLVGGATSVIGVLWPIRSATARMFTEEFYHYLLGPKKDDIPVLHLAEALRYACMRVRDSKDMKTPYHWAGFILHGIWFCSDILQKS